MRRVGNNWRITLRMRYKKKARGEVLEHMVLHGIANLVPPIPLPSTNYLILVFLDTKGLFGGVMYCPKK